MNTIQLTNGSILLRPYKESDLVQLYAAARESTAEVWQWLEWCHPDLSLAESRNFIRSQPKNWTDGTAYNFGIFNKKDNLYLGGCGLIELRRSDKVASMAYWVRTTETKKGIATASILLLAGFGFQELNLNRIELVIATNNISSICAAEKAGAVREGVLRNRYEAHGLIQDAFMFSLIRKDFDK
jgi:ribosomal-protein-serine acetyltransferase